MIIWPRKCSVKANTESRKSRLLWLVDAKMPLKVTNLPKKCNMHSCTYKKMPQQMDYYLGIQSCTNIA